MESDAVKEAGTDNGTNVLEDVNEESRTSAPDKNERLPVTQEESVVKSNVSIDKESFALNIDSATQGKVLQILLFFMKIKGTTVLKPIVSSVMESKAFIDPASPLKPVRQQMKSVNLYHLKYLRKKFKLLHKVIK